VGTESQKGRRNIKPPPKTVGDDWVVVVEELRGKFSIAQELADGYRVRGKTPTELRDDADQAVATAELPENLMLWTKSPLSAAALYLRNGRWPADGVVSLAQHEEAISRKTAAAARQKAAADAEAAARAAERARNDNLERKYGPTIETLDRAGIDDLLPFCDEFQRDYVRRARTCQRGTAAYLILLKAAERRDEQPARAII
jgi:hypothetical protein